MERPSTVPKLQMNLLQEETDPSANQLKEFYQLSNASVDNFIEDLLIVMLSNTNERQQSKINALRSWALFGAIAVDTDLGLGLGLG
uniref:Uncharacterized protein n=1 Tax=Panagrellus redivivus TaxID=6233 RepID=A0A7E4W2P5_PANRE